MATSDPSEPLLVVLAGNYQQFRFWCQENKRNPNDPSLRYASRMERLRGISGFHWLTYGTWYSTRTGREMYDYLWQMERMNRATRQC